MDSPTAEEIKKAVEEINRLAVFEAEHRMRCGWGLYQDSDVLPIPALVKTTAWLKHMAGMIRILDEARDYN